MYTNIKQDIHENIYMELQMKLFEFRTCGHMKKILFTKKILGEKNLIERKHRMFSPYK